MKKKIAKIWIDALESGEYRQTDGQLRATTKKGNESFCCLGVLCNLHAQAHPQIAAEQPWPHLYMGEESVLPDAVMEWAGMKTDDGTYGDSNSLVEDNDSGKSFKKIAQIIAERQKEL